MYFGLIRPVQKQLASELVLPIFDEVVSLNEDLLVGSQQDDITIESKQDKFLDVRISFPFGAYYFLVLFTLFGTKWNGLMRWMHAYNMFLFIVSPILVWTLLNEFHWVAPIINAHEIAYKALFLSLGMIISGREVQMIKVGTSIFSSSRKGL